ncbi:glycosyltransferase family 9 protein [Methylophaga sp.]|uniref:glycosyltransferase family 9 protein n=1 Tax=Methylophaga sp. TaxID=2024840 RepID=UPI003F6A096F
MSETHILLIKHGAFGDLLQADGVLRDIRTFYHHARITLLTAPAYKSLMQRNPYIDSVISDNRLPLWHIQAFLGLRKTLINADINQVIDLQNSQRSRLYRMLLLPKLPWLQRTAKTASVSGLQGLIDLLEQAGIPAEYARQADLTWMAEDMHNWLITQKIKPGFILLLPGCSARRSEKRWPFYPQLAETLTAKGKNVLTILGPDEGSLAPQFSGTVLTDLSWFQLAGVIKQACFVIGNDSGPSHLAAHIGQAGMAIFGPQSCPQRAEITREQFKPFSSSDLSTLRVDTVIDYLSERGVIVV